MISEIVQQLYIEQYPLVFSFGQLIGSSSKLVELSQNKLIYRNVIHPFIKIPISSNFKFENIKTFFEDQKALQFVILNETLEYDQILNELKEQNNDYKIVTFKKSLNEDLINFVKNELKIDVQDFIIFKDLKIYRNE
jgi:hypothetical protein